MHAFIYVTETEVHLQSIYIINDFGFLGKEIVPLIKNKSQ